MKPDAILLDDNVFVREAWEARLREAGRSLASFGDPDEMLAFISGAPADTPVFLDYELDDARSGADVARTLHAKGFRRLFLATAHAADDFKEIADCIAGVVGKEPPGWLLARAAPSTKLTAAEKATLRAHMAPTAVAVFEQRVAELEAAYFASLEGSHLDVAWPEAVLDAWERAIYEGVSDAELEARRAAAWRLA